MRRFVRVIGVCLLVLTGLAAVPVAQPVTVLADDVNLTNCDEASFDTALAAVQGSGGGTLAVKCVGTIDITSVKEITSNVTIVGDEAIFDGADSTRFFIVQPDARLELIGVTLQNGSGAAGGAINNGGTLVVTLSTFLLNDTTSSGGAIRNLGTLNVTASNFTQNSSSEDGGAILNADGAFAIIYSTVFSENSSDDSGGAIRNNGFLAVSFSTFDGNDSVSGGGAIVNNDSPAQTTVYASTFSNNTSGDHGGAIRNGGVLVINSSTFSANSSGAQGGAIRSSGGVQIFSSTFAGNSSDRGGETIHISGGNRYIEGSILTASGSNCNGDIGSNGSNVASDASCNLTQLTDEENSASIFLSPLGDYGGPTETMPPDTGSAALDTATCWQPLDQRDALRPTVEDCDKGSVEVGANVPVKIVAFVNVSGPVEVGEAAKLAAVAYGPDNSDLDYALDCDDDSVFETPAASFGTQGTGECTFSSGGEHTVGLEVCDGGGPSCATTTTTVTVAAEPIVPVTLCANYYTGALTAVGANGCPNGTYELTLPAANPVTFCINPYTGAMIWSPRGTCGTGYLAHVVPDDGPLSYCQNLWTGQLRYSYNGQCRSNEVAGVIPG